MMAAFTVMPKSVLNRDLTSTELQGCAVCGFEHYDPSVELLDAFNACPTCARQLGHVEVQVCSSCGELHSADDVCPCYGAVFAKVA